MLLLTKEKMMIRMIYPADRWVSESQIRNWYEDAVANGEIPPMHYDARFTIDDVYVEDMAKALQETGRFTFTES